MFNTDKIEPTGYFPQYLRIAAELGPRARVCEIGIWQGESLRMWQALFPLGEVVGVDQDGSLPWPPGTEKIVSRQDDPGLHDLLAPHAPFDLIVDDASHMGPPTLATFKMLWPLVAPGGYYVIEDWYMALLRPDEEFLAAATYPLRLMSTRDSECDDVTFKYGQVIAHKRAD